MPPARPVASSALRFYERKGLLRARRVGGKRVYDERAVEQVALIDLLKLAGFTLSEIAELVGPTGRTRAGLARGGTGQAAPARRLPGTPPHPPRSR